MTSLVSPISVQQEYSGSICPDTAFALQRYLGGISLDICCSPPYDFIERM